MRSLIVLAIMLIAMPAAAQLCAPTADPCVVDASMNVPGGSAFDLGDRDLVIGSGVNLNVQATDTGALSITARNITLQTNARIIGPGVGGNGASVLLIASGAFTMQTGSLIDVVGGSGGDVTVRAASASLLGQIRGNGSNSLGDGGFVDMAITGNLTVLGTGIQLNGGNGDSYGGFLFLSAGGNLEIGAEVQARGGSGGDADLEAGGTLIISTSGTVNNIALFAGNDGGDVSLAAGGALEIRGPVLSRGQGSLNEGGGFGGDVDMLGRSVLIASQIEMTGAGPDGDGGFLDVSAEEDITISAPLLIGGAGDGGGGEVDLFTRGRVELNAAIDLRGGFVGGVFDVQSAGEVWLGPAARVNADFIPGSAFGGYGGVILIDGCTVTVENGAILTADGVGGLPRATIRLRAGSTMTVAGSLTARNGNELYHRGTLPTVLPAATLDPAATIVEDLTIPCCVGCPTTTSTSTTTTTSSSSSSTTSTSSSTVTSTSVTSSTSTSSSSSSTTSTSLSTTSSTSSSTSTSTSTSIASTTSSTTLPPTCLDQPLEGYEAAACALGELESAIAAEPDDALGGARSARGLAKKVLKTGLLVERSQSARKPEKLLGKAQRKIQSFERQLGKLLDRQKIDPVLVEQLLALSGELALRIEGMLQPL